MPKRSKQARAHEFSQKARVEIINRDNGRCLFCDRAYHMEQATWFGCEVKSIMHYIPRAQGGLGIAQNGVLGCEYHHEMMDNGNKGLRAEMLEIIKNYLSGNYKGWNEEKLIYHKDFNARSTQNSNP